MGPRLVDRLFIFFPWLLAAAWIGAFYLPGDEKVLSRSTNDILNGNEHLIQSYARRFGEAPPTLNELRLYARMQGRRYQGYDAWGERLEYIRLGKVNYTLRSFGSDGVQNTPNSELDPGFFRWGQMVKLGLQYDYDAGVHQSRPSVVLFAGADDDQRQWHAKLFIDPTTGARRLLLRSHKQQNLYMLAPHDGIEEFLWLPGGKQIVFSASGSARYADGLWIWDLASDESWNLLQLDEKDHDLSPAQQQRGFYVALSHVEASNPPTVAAFVVPIGNIPMDAARFFHPDNLHFFHVKDRTVQHVRPLPNPAQQKTLFDYEWMGASTVASVGEGAALQKAWQRLPRTGKWEQAMQGWQDFAAAHAQSPLAAYAVWSLALFYADAGQQSAAPAKEAEILRGYSRELINGLARMQAAPGWLRSVAASSANHH